MHSQPSQCFIHPHVTSQNMTDASATVVLNLNMNTWRFMGTYNPNSSLLILYLEDLGGLISTNIVGVRSTLNLQILAVAAVSTMGSYTAAPKQVSRRCN